MKKYSINITLVIAAIALLLRLPDGSPANAQGDDAPAWSGQKWEYRVLRIDDRRQSNTSGTRSRGSTSEAKLNELGKQGWELVSVRSDTTGNEPVFYFKRPAK